MGDGPPGFRRKGVFSLGRWSSRIPTEFLVFRRTQDPPRCRPPGFRRNSSCSAVLRILLGAFQISSTGFLPSLTDFSKSVDYLKELPYRSPTTPTSQLVGLGFSRFARRYSGNRIFFLFLQVLRCFRSLRLPRMRYVFTQT